MKSIKRKCIYCKKPVILNGNEIDFIYEKKCYAHINCFVEYKKNLRKGKWTDQQCDLYIQKLHDNTNCRVSEIINKHNTVENRAKEKTAHKKQLDSFYDYLSNTYDISTFTNQFFIKIANIENGTYKQVTKPIPVTDLLDMWQQKINYLNKVAVNNQKKGKELLGLSRINYDLAILLSKYDSYLAWKERQRVEKEEIEKRLSEEKNKIEYERLDYRCGKSISNDNIHDFDSIIDEI